MFAIIITPLSPLGQFENKNCFKYYTWHTYAAVLLFFVLLAAMSVQQTETFQQQCALWWHFFLFYTDIHGLKGWLPMTLVIPRLFLLYSGRPCQPLDSLSLTFVQIFMVPRGWIAMTLLIPCPLAPPAGQNFHLLNNINSCSTTTRLTFMVWVKYQHLFDGLQWSFLQTAILFRIIAITLVIWLLI